ncbi:MAG: hypothetical protein ACT4P1_01415 [Sporichthyaceae bacterium]
MLKKAMVIGLAAFAAKRLRGRGRAAALDQPAQPDVSPEPGPLESWADEGGALINGSPAQERAPSP